MQATYIGPVSGPLLALVKSQGGFVKVLKTVDDQAVHVSYETSVPVYVALGCLAGIVVGWLLSRTKKAKPFGWVLMIGSAVGGLLTVPIWMQEQITYDDTKVTRVMSRWFLPHTVTVNWDDVQRVVVTNVEPNLVKKRNKSYLEFLMKNGDVVNWGNISSSSLVGEVIEDIFLRARQHGIPVESQQVKER